MDLVIQISILISLIHLFNSVANGKSLTFPMYSAVLAFLLHTAEYNTEVPKIVTGILLLLLVRLLLRNGNGEQNESV